MNLLLTLALPGVVAVMLMRSFASGLRVALALLVLLPISMRIELGGGIPALTVHRLILVVLGLAWMRQSRSLPVRQVPLLLLLLLSFGSALLSTVVSLDPLASLKSSLSLTLEFMLVYLVVATQDFSREELSKLVRSVALALGIVAVIAGIEKYTGVNLASLLVGGASGDSDDGRMIEGTYPHRILFGYAMVFGWLYAAGLVGGPFGPTNRWSHWVLMLLPIAGCYFSVSRGPWLGMAMAIVGMGFIGGRKLRVHVTLLVTFAALVLLARPGVWETIQGLMNSTFERDSLKGRSYEYRWKLWSVAVGEISKSPVRTLLGYGGGTTDEMDLSLYFGNQEGGGTAITGFTSWDNQYASDLVEYGALGFLLNLVLLAGVLWRAVVVWRQAPTDWQPFAVTLLGAVLVYLFAMTNVSIFAPQLKYLFWATAGLLVALPRLMSAEETAEPTSENVDEVTPLEE